MNYKPTYLFLISIWILSSFSSIIKDEQTAEIKLITTINEFEVGKSITLQFSTNENKRPMLYCSNSYGSTLVTPSFEEDILNFRIPQNISNKSGLVNWKLLTENNPLIGSFKINPKKNVVKMETYLGPPNLVAGIKDYTMLVVIPTDEFDNPVKDSTVVNVKHQFLSLETKEDVLTHNLFAYKNIYSKKENGRMIISSECLSTNSKEYTIDILPSNPINFSITSQRDHNYADGNQITTFSTSTILDDYGNIVSDGTFVEFYIVNKNNNILKLSGLTINGIASAKILNPDHEEQWQISAIINGIAQSNVITLKYMQAVKDYQVDFSKNNRIITVGHLKSFMNQTIPDGLLVTLSIYDAHNLVQEFIVTSDNGYANFVLNNNIFKNGSYNIIIKTAGITKSYKNKNLW